MSLPPFADNAAFELRYSGTVPAADDSRILALLMDASTLIREIAGDDYVDDAGELETFPDVFTVICVEAVRRVYDNPQGLTGETIGNYAWRGPTNGGAVSLTPDEVRAIRRAAGNLGLVSVTLSSDLPCVYSEGDIW